MVAHISIISESESIHYHSLSVMFTPLHSSVIQQLFEKYVCNQSSHYAEIWWYRTPQLSSETEVSIAFLCQLCSTRYAAVRIKKCLKNTSVIKVATMKNTDNFSLRKEAITCNHQINAIHCQQRWIPEECIGCTAVCQKAPLGLKRRRTVKKSIP